MAFCLLFVAFLSCSLIHTSEAEKWEAQRQKIAQLFKAVEAQDLASLQNLGPLENSINWKDPQSRQTLLETAVKKGNVGIISYLLKNTEESFLPSRGCEPVLWHALESDSKPMIECFLAHCHFPPECLKSLAGYAFMGKKISLIRPLLEAGGTLNAPSLVSMFSSTHRASTQEVIDTYLLLGTIETFRTQITSEFKSQASLTKEKPAKIDKKIAQFNELINARIILWEKKREAFSHELTGLVNEEYLIREYLF